jgi:hypothetical protein
VNVLKGPNAIIGGSVLIEACLWGGLFLWYKYLDTESKFFSPGDYWRYLENTGRKPDELLPKESKEGTFEPRMQQYFGLAKILITLAAAAISFGGLEFQHNRGVYESKIVLALSILYGLLFCVFCLKYYEDYTLKVDSYIPRRIALVESLGLTCVILFFLGFFFWALHLKPEEPKPSGSPSGCTYPLNC